MANVTHPIPCSQVLIMDSFAIASAVLLYVLFVSLGMSISFREARNTLKHPTGVILAQLGQFVLLPLAGWGIARAFALPVAVAVGMVAITTSPGGAISNIIAVFYQADIPLSVCATTISSVLAIGLMPLNQYIYLIAANLAPGVCLNVSGIILAAGIVVAGSLTGIQLMHSLQKQKYYRIIKFFYALGSLSGLAIIILGFVANASSNMPITALPGKLAGATLLPYLIGTIGGLIVSSLPIFRLPKPSRVTIALEIGIQNKLVAISALAFIFPVGSPARTASLAVPLLYALYATTISFVWVGIAWKLGWTNLPREKGFIEAFRIARAKAAEERDREIRGEAREEGKIEEEKIDQGSSCPTSGGSDDKTKTSENYLATEIV